MPYYSHVHFIRRIVPALMLCLYGCTSVGPDYEPAQVEVASQWLEAEDQHLKASEPQGGDWWTIFNDAEINRLVEQAYRENLTLQIAGTRVLEARAQFGSALGALYPQTQQMTGSLIDNRLSQHAYQAAFSHIFNYDQAQIGLTASWEIDFWGKFRRNIEAADANLQGAVADYDNALVSLIADVTQSYINIRTVEKRLAIARQNVNTQQESLSIAEIRYNGGTTSERDVEQARTVLANTKALIPNLEIALRQALNGLSVLLGKPPMPADALIGGESRIPNPPASVAVGIPTQLLRRRPDVRKAEFQAAAQSASVGVTKAQLYPAISLTGTFGLLSTDSGTFSLGDAFNWSSRIAAFGPTVQWNIFNYGQITNQVRVQDARLQALLITYQNVVLNAQREVENNLVAYLRAHERAQLLSESTAAAQRSLELAVLQYREGITDFTTVLTAQQALLAEQDSLAATLGDIAVNLVGVYRALGGGWQIRQGQDFLPDKIKQQMDKRSNWGDLLSPASQPDAEPGQPARMQAPRW
jgi:NodT family efflux transporter outer membrane factor (OMF) lipoprotein